jgi:hypothetical protein
LVTLDRTYIRFRFKINLHIDDLQVLNIIKSNLNIGRIIVEEKRSSCAFVVQNFSVPCVFKNNLFGKFLYNYMFLNKSIITVKPYRLRVIPSHLAYSSESFLERSCNGFTGEAASLEYLPAADAAVSPPHLVIQRLINSGLLYLSSPVKKIFKQINQVRFYSSPAAQQHLVPSQLTGQYLIKLDP